MADITLVNQSTLAITSATTALRRAGLAQKTETSGYIGDTVRSQHIGDIILVGNMPDDDWQELISLTFQRTGGPFGDGGRYSVSKYGNGVRLQLTDPLQEAGWRDGDTVSVTSGQPAALDTTVEEGEESPCFKLKFAIVHNGISMGLLDELMETRRAQLINRHTDEYE